MSSEANKPLHLFIARSSGASKGDTEATKTFLKRSLEYTRQVYEEEFGLLDPDLVFFWVFIQSSNRPFSGQGETRTTIRKILERGKSENRPVVLVINGWDGLSTSPVALTNLLGPYVDQVNITLEMFVETPRRFRKVSVPDALRVLSDEYEGEFNDLVLPHSTLEFCRKVNVIRIIKMNLSENNARLKEESEGCNIIPDTEDKWPCPICEQPFRTSARLNSHTHSVHPTKSEQKNLFCPHCGEQFSRKDHKDDHVEAIICKEHPGYNAKQAAKQAEQEAGNPAPKRASRGTKRTRTQRRTEEATSSDGAAPSYYDIKANTANFPPVDISLPEAERVIYRDEVWCRYPGCCHPHQFSSPSKLRTHYRTIHNFLYPAQGRSPQKDRVCYEQAGLKYLAKCAHFGWQNVDPAPDPSSVPPVRLAKRARTTAKGDDDASGGDSVDRGNPTGPPD
ncbi:hypothetical protein ASPCAL13132 [Aspergillus calidoustus]|uniref:C2H2-type domain-containing protein n=1 Tax=Aspergillus calidoustus TaxID=454130 RepID=A0A0U4ZK99_ASPCI|nr:hypothetical protein ASPCAL13132 [Aspergillus calidoustus]